MQNTPSRLKNNKNDIKTLRVKYLRNLEKFASAAVNALKKEEFDKTKFEERMLKNKNFFQNCEATPLHASYPKNLENFVLACLDFSKDKAELLSLANALDKQKKQGQKKQKHKNFLKDYE